jgi:hypothetical protein
MRQGKGNGRETGRQKLQDLKGRGGPTWWLKPQYIDGFNLHGTGSTNTTTTEDLADVDHIGDGIGSSSKLQ